MAKKARVSENQLPLWIDAEAPERVCPRCKTRLICVRKCDYGAFTEWTYRGCGCYATQTTSISTLRKG